MSYDKCVRCGACVRICPLFTAREEEQFTPRAKTYLLQVMDLIEDDEEIQREFRQLLFQCTMCGRCEEVCSSDVDLLRIYHEQRAKALETAPEEFEYLNSLRKALANVKNIYGLDPEDRAVFWIDELIDDIPDIEDRVYEEGKTAEVMVFLGCLMSFRATQMDVVKSLFKSLERVGADYMVMGAQEFCCGHPLYLMGDDEGAEDLRRHNKEVVEKAQAKTVITCCPGCLIQLKNYHNFEGVEVLHHTQYFDRILDEPPQLKRDEEFAYHDPCELHRISNVKTEPRSLMRKIGVKWREMELSCCGGGGLLRMTDPDLSDKIIEVRKQKEHMEGTTVLTCCPSCREQFMSAGIKTKDIVEMLDEAFEEQGRSTE
ncbi:MAG: (Fe-S)-binding protein [Candidatus Thorarchaeota archaeon]